MRKILPSQTLMMNSLFVDHYIDDIWIFEDENSTAHHDKECSTLYLLNKDDDEDICCNIGKFICDSSDLSADSRSLIERILRYRYDNYGKIHDFLDDKKIRSLPEKSQMDESFDLYGESGVVDDVEADEQHSLYNNTEDEYRSSLGDSSSTEVDTQGYSDALTGQPGEEQLGVEIPPP